MDCLRDKFVPGQLLDDRFLTVAPLNHGSFGMVFLAKDTQTGEQVAIKCLTKPSSADAAGCLSVDDKSEELDCHTRLGHHPNLVNLLHSFETSTHLFLVLEYCSMGDLYEAIKNNRGPLETEHVRAFMLQLIDGVQYMHNQGLYHRDIKPENIFLCQDGSMKLGDFGLATRSPWSFEACVGSDRYMAPEQYEPTPAGYSTPHADVWSIGICLLNILFARNPFATPTESDVLFADFSRDRQSLFDVFPNMSQDTFEILSHSLVLDPKRRSLTALRGAITRAVSFTTDDESLDDFCTEDRDMFPASADREPLRTPSIQSPQINQGDSFPWAKALQSTPQQPIRQLSAIPDTESYSEDLFPPSDFEGSSWFSVHPVSPSIASTFGNSFRSMALAAPSSRFTPARPRPDPISESLPATGARPIPAMSMVFGKGKPDQVSKSWSDLWDEEEEEEMEMENALKARHEQNSRTWSQDSKDSSKVASADSHRPVLGEVDVSSTANSLPIAIGNAKNAQRISSPLKSEVLKENAPPVDGNFRSPRYSPPKRSPLDKWAALGDRRRNHHSDEHVSQLSSKLSPKITAWRKDSLADGNRRCPFNEPRSELLNRDWRRDPPQTIKPKKTLPSIPTYDGTLDDDFDWIGGWHDVVV